MDPAADLSDSLTSRRTNATPEQVGGSAGNPLTIGERTLMRELPVCVADD